MLLSVLPLGTAFEPEMFEMIRPFGTAAPLVGAFCQDGSAADPPVARNWPEVPGISAAQDAAPR
jgi:hypothetical protein